MLFTRRSHLLATLSAMILLLIGGLTPQATHGEEVLPERDRERLSRELRDLTGEVRMIMFTQELECQFCVQTRQLLAELASMSDRLELSVFDFVHDQQEAQHYGVDKIPATVLMTDDDVGICYYGVPAGYELAALVETIKELSAGATGLSQEARTKLKDLSGEIHIQVFVTPTCPYCPGAVRAAFQLAQESEKIRADGVEVIEFPHLVNKYHVRGVPMVVINETTSFVGAQSDLFFVEKMLEATQESSGDQEVGQ